MLKVLELLLFAEVLLLFELVFFVITYVPLLFFCSGTLWVEVLLRWGFVLLLLFSAFINCWTFCFTFSAVCFKSFLRLLILWVSTFAAEETFCSTLLIVVLIVLDAEDTKLLTLFWAFSGSFWNILFYVWNKPKKFITACTWVMSLAVCRRFLRGSRGNVWKCNLVRLC